MIPIKIEKGIYRIFRMFYGLGLVENCGPPRSDEEIREEQRLEEEKRSRVWSDWIAEKYRTERAYNTASKDKEERKARVYEENHGKTLDSILEKYKNTKKRELDERTREELINYFCSQCFNPHVRNPIVSVYEVFGQDFKTEDIESAIRDGQRRNITEPFFGLPDPRARIRDSEMENPANLEHHIASSGTVTDMRTGERYSCSNNEGDGIFKLGDMIKIVYTTYPDGYRSWSGNNRTTRKIEIIPLIHAKIETR